MYTRRDARPCVSTDSDTNLAIKHSAILSKISCFRFGLRSMVFSPIDNFNSIIPFEIKIINHIKNRILK